jgi:hypothetical protein
LGPSIDIKSKGVIIRAETPLQADYYKLSLDQINQILALKSGMNSKKIYRGYQ